MCIDECASNNNKKILVIVKHDDSAWSLETKLTKQPISFPSTILLAESLGQGYAFDTQRNVERDPALAKHFGGYIYIC